MNKEYNRDVAIDAIKQLHKRNNVKTLHIKKSSKQQILDKIDNINQDLMSLSIMLDNSSLSRSEVREIAQELTDVNKDDNLKRL